jgi:hypothetical protein
MREIEVAAREAVDPLYRLGRFMDAFDSETEA